MIFVVVFNSTTTKDRERLCEALRNLGTTCQLSHSACLLCTRQSVAEVTLAVQPLLESDDHFYIAPLTYIHSLSKRAQAWIAAEQQSETPNTLPGEA
jgi:hypothetical protein